MGYYRLIPGSSNNIYDPSRSGKRPTKNFSSYGNPKLTINPKGAYGKSWSTSLSIAGNRFAGNQPAKKYIDYDPEISVIFVANTGASNNFFLDAEPLYKVRPFMEMAEEKEVISLGNVEIKEILIKTRDWIF